MNFVSKTLSNILSEQTHHLQKNIKIHSSFIASRDNNEIVTCIACSTIFLIFTIYDENLM